MTGEKLTLARDVTREECHWLPSDLARGTEIYRYTQYTYGCISPSGIAISLEPDGPFLEVPRAAILKEPRS